MSRNRPNKKGKKSNQWVVRQNRDPFVKQAKSQGLRARSVFKLAQIDKKFRLIKPQSSIIDLGSTPGSWSQYAAARVSGENQIVSVDLLPMRAIAKVRFIQGDFTDAHIRQQIIDCCGCGKIDLVLSDMAPNITGIRITDQAKAQELQDAILEFCLNALDLRGNLLTKLFAGELANLARNRFSHHFDQVQMIKPDASRPESKEIYLLARGFNLA